MNQPAGQRVFVLIPTHTTRHLAACLASLAHQTRLPDGVVLTCDTDLPEIAALARDWWPKVCQRAGVQVPFWHAMRPHQGQPRLNQVRNNGLRALIGWAGAASNDLVVVLDGDTMLEPRAVEKHAALRDAGAELIIPFRIMLSEQATAALTPESLLAGGVPETLLTPEDAAALAKRNARYLRQMFFRFFGIGKPQKPKIIGGHHAATVGLLQRVNGFDEQYTGYGCDDDDLSRRINLLRPRARARIAVRYIMSYHLWHPTRAAGKPAEFSGFARFSQPGLPLQAERGIINAMPQPEVSVMSL